MMTRDERADLLARAYVPEHLVDLMTAVSGAEPFVVDGHLCLIGPGWAVVVGYPLGDPVPPDALAALLREGLARFRIRRAWVVAPRLPADLIARSVEHDSDWYYTLDLGQPPAARLRRVADRARERLVVETTRDLTGAHDALMQELFERAAPPARVRQLWVGLPAHVRASPDCVVLDARDRQGRLVAFQVVDFSARHFSCYVLGTASRGPHASHASDLLVDELITRSAGRGKSYVHLGLGVNDGIRRFKAKWGGQPTRRHEMAAIVLGRPSLLETIARRAWSAPGP